MKKKLLLIFSITLVLRALLTAQDTIPHLIISEERLDWSANSYIELTNMGDSALDLSQFILSSPFTGVGNYVFYFEPNTILDPKESYVLTNYYEEQDQNWVELQDLADYLVYQEDAGYPNDSVSLGAYILQSWNGRYSTLLWYKRSDVDSLLIDCFNWNTDADGNAQKIQGGQPIAGVVEPVYYNTLIRKSHVVRGNLGNWDASRGVDAADSEWLLAEHTNPQVLPFRTVGNHGENYSIDVTSANPDVVIDLDNGTLTVPWGIPRGDSIIRQLVLGDGMAWWYVEKPVFEDSLHTVMQTGDILQLKSFGDDMTVKELAITVTDPKDDMNEVFPRRTIHYPDPEVDPPGTVKVIGGTPYYVTKNMPGIDTIGDVPFAARVDTFYKYLEWASNASVGIIWKDGNERVDLMNGDLLEVTAANGDKKQYYIDVQEYAESDNADLSAITWPDISMEDKMFDLNWMSDTLPGFAPNVYNYNVTLRYGTKKVPAFKAYAEDLNAKISYEPAVSLKGGFEERTTVITVTSESDTTIRNYNITFTIEERAEDKQKLYADPYFSEFHQRSYAGAEVLELVNPGTESLDLSRYLITRIMGNDAVNSVTQTLDYMNRYNIYVPGYRFTDDTAAYENEDYKTLVTFDSDVDPILEPGDVFIIGGGEPSRIKDHGYLTNPDDWDITFPENEENAWGIIFPRNTGLTNRNLPVAFYLWRIENDSILDGTKAIGDLNDLTLIDVLGHSDGRKFTDIYGWSGNTGGGISIIRKSNIWHGNTSYESSGGTTPENSEWIVRDRTVYGYDAVLATLGSQVLDPVTGYISTVSSLAYLVDNGYQGDLGITGISNGETVQQFYDNLIKADTGQDLTVKTGTDGAILNPADPVSQGDTLVVVSADGTNVTKYVLDTTPLDNNVNLITSEGSMLTISNDAVSGFEQGATLESVFEGVKTQSDLSIINIIDASGALVPLKVMDANGDYHPVLATSGISFEVVAQSGDRAEYQLTPNSDAGDAFVLSSVYEVNNEFHYISGIPGGTAVSAFMDNIIPAEGATATIIDKADYDRTMGNLAYDDLLKVVSEDGTKTVTYLLNFMEEVIVNTEPTVTVASDNIEAETGVATSVSATAEDDGLPSGTLTYTWSVSSGEAANVTIANPDQLTTDVTFSAEGSYTLQLAVNDGELESTATVSVTVTSTGIGITKSEFRMFPNPARESVILEMLNKDSSKGTVTIYSVTGKAVYNSKIENNRKVIGLSHLDAGIYFVTIKVGAEFTRAKLTITK